MTQSLCFYNSLQPSVNKGPSQLNHAFNYGNNPCAHEFYSYSIITGCVFEHFINHKELAPLEKLFYIAVNNLSSTAFSIANKKGVDTARRAYALPASDWAKRLGCSSGKIFQMQKALEGKGYFAISREFNKTYQNKRNLIMPTLPDKIFKHLCKSTPNRHSAGTEEHLFFDASRESKLDYLDRVKLFVPIGHKFLKWLLAHKELSSLEKLLLLDFVVILHKKHVAADEADIQGNTFVSTFTQIMNRHNLSKYTISRVLRLLVDKGFLLKERLFFKKEEGLNERRDQSLWKFSLTLPKEIMSTIAMRVKQSDEASKVEDSVDNTREKGRVVADSDPGVADSDQSYNNRYSSLEKFKSNLREKEVLLDRNNFRKKKDKNYSIHSEIIRSKLKEISQEKADKVRRFAYSIYSQQLAKGYAATLTKNELTKQLIYHTSSWKPTNLGSITREDEIDAALSIGWRKITNGTWQEPLALQKARIFDYELKSYKDKYQQQEVLSPEIDNLESDISSSFGMNINLKQAITHSREKGREAEGKPDKQNVFSLSQLPGLAKPIQNQLTENKELKTLFDEIRLDIHEVYPCSYHVEQKEHQCGELTMSQQIINLQIEVTKARK